MAKTKKKTSVAKTKDTAVPSEMAEMFEDDAGAGQEQMDKDDFAIPRMSILQALSPQVKKGDAQIEGAEEGTIFDSVSEVMVDGEAGIYVVPISYRRAYIEWRLREDNGGGFVNDHGTNSDVMLGTKKDDRLRDITKDGTQIVPTAEYICFIVDKKTGAMSAVCISMSGTQLKKAKRWNTLINTLQIPRVHGDGTFNPAMFYKVYHLSTVPESNAKGDWFGWKIAPDEDVIKLPGGMEVYKRAKEFREAISTGDVKVAAHVDTGDAEEGDDDPM